MDQLSRSGALLRPLTHHPMALHHKRGTESRTCRAERKNPPSELARVHGTGFGELVPGTYQINVTPLPGRSPEEARDARVRAWMYVFEVWNRKKEAATSPVSRPDNEKGKSSNDSLATTDCTR
jgi:hypothetical protein